MSAGTLARFAIAFALALVFLSQGLSAPFEKDEEARPASIVKDIVHHHQWLLPRDSYREPTRKPPLYYWLSAAAAEVRGGVVDESTARSVSLIAAAAMAGLVAVLASGWLDEAGGWLALAFLLGMWGFASHAGYARTDMLLSLLLYAGYCALFEAIEGVPRRRHWLGGGILLGLAILTKGPLALVLAALAITIHFIWSRRNPLTVLGLAWPWLTVAVAIGTGLAWYVPAFLKERQGLIAVQLMQENLGHLLPATMGGTGEASRPFYYLLARFVGAALPLSCYIPALFATPLNGRKAENQLRYQASMIVAVLLLFSLASAKRDDYIVPAFAPLAILLAALFSPRGELLRPHRTTARSLREAGSAVAAGGCLIIASFMIWLAMRGEPPGWMMRHLGTSDRAYLSLLVTGLKGHGAAEPIAIAGTMLGSLFALLALVRRQPVQAAAGVAVAGIAAVSLFLGVLRPELTSSRTLKFFAAKIHGVVGDRPLFVLGGPEYEMSFYYGDQPLVPWNGSDPLPGNPPYFVVAQTNLLNLMSPAWKPRTVTVATSDTPFSTTQDLLLKIATSPFEPSAGK